jgi:hypothetical protein
LATLPVAEAVLQAQEPSLSGHSHTVGPNPKLGQLLADQDETADWANTEVLMKPGLQLAMASSEGWSQAQRGSELGLKRFEYPQPQDL